MSGKDFPTNHRVARAVTRKFTHQYRQTTGAQYRPDLRLLQINGANMQTNTTQDFDSIDSLDSLEDLVLVSESANDADVAAPDATAPSVYEYLAATGKLGKLTEIAMKKGGTPGHLRDETRQAVQAKWCAHKANTKYAPNQIYYYAALLGKDEALKVRRDMGAAVVLPASMFEKAGSDAIKNSVFAQSIGSAVNPMCVEDFADSMEYSVSDEDRMPERATPLQVRNRLHQLTLTRTQRQIAELICCRGLALETVTEHLGLTRPYVERLVTQITAALHTRDDELLAA